MRLYDGIRTCYSLSTELYLNAYVQLIADNLSFDVIFPLTFPINTLCLRIMQLGILHIASLITIFQSVLLAFFLLNRRKGTFICEKILGTFLFTFAILIYCSFVMSTTLATNKIHIILATMAYQFIFLVGPLFYFYIKSLLFREFTFTYKNILHFFPFLTLLISTFIIIQLSGLGLLYRSIFFYINGFICLHILFYIIISIQIMKNHGLIISNLSSNIKNQRSSWIIFLLAGLISVWLFKLGIFIGWDLSGISRWCQYTATTFFLTTFIFINPIMYIALKKPELFTHKNKYNQSALSGSGKQSYLNRLLACMKFDKPHLQPSISLPELAKLLSIPKHHLSQVINESFDLNFNDFINKYRIDEALLLLQDRANNNRTILEIAYRVGFNSKSTFNSAFKKHTGQTPKEFKNSGKVQTEFASYHLHI